MCGLRTGKQSQKSRQEGSNEKKSPGNESESYVGDGLTLKMDSNEKDIDVTGDGCRLTLATNRGRIRINGDGCRLRIEKNSGDIEYRGDGGRVSLGPNSTGTKVHYFGEGGRVNIGGTVGSIHARNSSVSGAAASRKNDPRDINDFDACTGFLDNILTDREPRRILRTINKTVRIVCRNPKIVSPTRTRTSCDISETCTIAN